MLSCLGDIVGYGSDLARVVELARMVSNFRLSWTTSKSALIGVGGEMGLMDNAGSVHYPRDPK